MEYGGGAVGHALDPLAGRATETETLERVLDAARSGRPQVVVIEAEPGMGKSALLQAFLARHHTHCTVRSVRCAEFEQNLAFGIADLLLDDNAPSTRSEIEVGRRLLSMLGDLRSARHGCVVVTIDDEQWIDGASAKALRFALRRLRTDRVLCLVARRPDAHASAVATTDVPVTTTVLRPGPLGPGAVRDLARRLRSWELPDQTVERLISRTGGVPLLVAALVRGVADPGQFESGAEVPASVTAAAIRLLDAVDEPARRLTEAAAVVAEPADLVVLGRTADVADPSAAVTATVSGGLLRIDGAGRVECAHALLREAFYCTLSPVRRRDLHASAAQWTTGDRQLAHRVAAADRPDPRLVADLLDAAAAARRELKYGLAATHRLRARTVCDDPVQRERLLPEALIERVEAQDLAGARDLAPDVVDTPSTACRSLALGLLARESGQVGPARTWLQAALDLATCAGDATLAGRAALAMAVLHVRLGDGVAAIEVLTRPDSVDDRELSMDMLTTTALGLWQTGELGRALDLVNAAPISRDRSAAEADLVAVRAMIRLYAGRLRPALADLDQAVRLAHLWRPSTNQSRIYGLRSMTRFLVGDWDGASVDAAAGRALAQGSVETWSAALALAVSVQVPAHRGQWDIANRYLARARNASAGYAEFPIFERLLSHEVAAAVARDDHRAVLDALTPVWSDDYLRRLSLVRYSRELMQARIAALAKLGRVAEAQADLARYEAMLHDFPEGPVPRRLGWLHGLIAEARALPHRAREHYAADLDDDDLKQVPFLQAQLLQTSGRLERALGDRREAIRRLSQAQDILAKLQATPSLQRCRADLAACGVQSPSTDPLALTQREEDVAALVQRGCTNKEVAAELFLTVKTVEYHLRNTYAKLGVAGRQDLRRLRSAAAYGGDGSVDIAGHPCAGS